MKEGNGKDVIHLNMSATEMERRTKENMYKTNAKEIVVNRSNFLSKVID